jgi:hypothetical protein
MNFIYGDSFSEDSKKVEMAGGCYLVLFDTIFFVTVCFVSSGASSPEWVKPTAERGGLEFRMFVLSCGLVYVMFREILST